MSFKKLILSLEAQRKTGGKKFILSGDQLLKTYCVHDKNEGGPLYMTIDRGSRYLSTNQQIPSSISGTSTIKTALHLEGGPPSLVERYG